MVAKGLGPGRQKNVLAARMTLTARYCCSASPLLQCGLATVQSQMAVQ
jgi:hypothetical protein